MAHIKELNKHIRKELGKARKDVSASLAAKADANTILALIAEDEKWEWAKEGTVEKDLKAALAKVEQAEGKQTALFRAISMEKSNADIKQEFANEALVAQAQELVTELAACVPNMVAQMHTAMEDHLAIAPTDDNPLLAPLRAKLKVKPKARGKAKGKAKAKAKAEAKAEAKATAEAKAKEIFLGA